MRELIFDIRGGDVEVVVALIWWWWWCFRGERMVWRVMVNMMELGTFNLSVPRRLK